MITKKITSKFLSSRSQQEPFSSPMAIPVRVFYWYILPIHSSVHGPYPFKPKRQNAAHSPLGAARVQKISCISLYSRIVFSPTPRDLGGAGRVFTAVRFRAVPVRLLAGSLGSPIPRVVGIFWEC